jgi:hypothetical protein
MLSIARRLRSREYCFAVSPCTSSDSQSELVLSALNSRRSYALCITSVPALIARSSVSKSVKFLPTRSHTQKTI